MIIDFYGNGGGSGSGVTPEEVQAQIDSALTVYTPTSGFSTINGSAITDGSAIEIDADLTDYWTSAQTEEAISAATSGKADASSVTANTGRTLFPTWNSQGIITGAKAEASDKTVKVNGSTFHFYSSEGFDLPSIYSPKSAGTAGDILVSKGSGAPVWSAVTIPDLSNYWDSAATQAHIDSAYTSATTHIEDVERVTAAALNELHSEVDAISGASENYITSAYVNTALASYTPTSGFSTINGSAITAGGNLVIEGGSGSVNIIELTKAEYNALSAYTEDAIYVITDADAINMDDYATSAQVETQITSKGYITSGDVNTALASYTPTSGFSTINGSAITAGGNLVIEGGGDLSAYWTSAQTQTAITTATANMVTSTTVTNIWRGTQAQYDQISPKDPNALYIILAS